jgi:hypothetical protein
MPKIESVHNMQIKGDALGGLAAPAYDAGAVTPSDVTVFDPPFRALYIGGDGDVSVVTLGGTTVAFTGAAAGSILPVGGSQVLAATTATGVVALY